MSLQVVSATRKGWRQGSASGPVGGFQPPSCSVSPWGVQSVAAPLSSLRLDGDSRGRCLSQCPRTYNLWSNASSLQIVRTEGIKGLYRGCAVNVLKTAPGAAIQFVAYDFIKTGVMMVDPTAGVTSPL